MKCMGWSGMRERVRSIVANQGSPSKRLPEATALAHEFRALVESSPGAQGVMPDLAIPHVGVARACRPPYRAPSVASAQSQILPSRSRWGV